MEFKRYSLHNFSNREDITFNPIEYSRFKFGCKSIARKFGNDLSLGFIKSTYFKEIIETLRQFPEKRVVIMSSPYVHIPTPTFALKDYFLKILNRVLVDSGFKPAIETKISRASSYKEDYGEMNKEQRFNIMKNDVFHVDGGILQNNICLFLDDIVITGAHEHRIRLMLEKYDLINDQTYHYFLFFAQLTNNNEDPTIENYLNYAFIQNLKSINKLIREEEFILNTRVTKYILDSDNKEFQEFISYQTFTFRDTLYHMALGNSYHLIPDYQKNLNYLKKYINYNN